MIKNFFFDTPSIKKQTTIIHSTYKDNKYLTEDDTQQIENLKDINYNDYKVYALGQWGRIEVEKPFAYAFDIKKHVKKGLTQDSEERIILSFDFNIDPITCIACQHDVDYIHVLKEFRLMNSNIYELCEAIHTEYAGQSVYFQITGDATGRGRSAMTQGGLNYYKIIREQLGINDSAFRLPKVNPNVKNSRVLLNALLIKFPIFVNESCKFLIDDLLYCEVNDNGELDKTKDKHRSHLLDCFRYYLNAFHTEKHDKKTLEYLTK